MNKLSCFLFVIKITILSTGSKRNVPVFTDLEDIGKESRADPLAGEVIEASETGEGTDQGSVGRRPHSPHLEKTT